MAEQFGTEMIEKVFDILIEFGENLEKKLEDGKVSAAEALSLAFDALPDIYNIAKNGAQLKAEYQDWSEAEKREVLTRVAEKFNLEADAIEVKIEKGLEMLMAVNTFLREFQPEAEG